MKHPCVHLHEHKTAYQADCNYKVFYPPAGTPALIGVPTSTTFIPTERNQFLSLPAYLSTVAQNSKFKV